jgi:chloramphenicol 3-O-phosphotransferase
MEKGKIIFLNGVSSSGKTTLAKSLQEQLLEPFYWIAIDTFIDMMPQKYKYPKTPEAMSVCLRTISIAHKTIKYYVDMGVNIIVEHIFHTKGFMEECLELLHDCYVLFVHVTCPLEELRHREKKRENHDFYRIENQLQNLNPKNNNYDIIIDTYNNSKEENVNKITEILNQPNKNNAFKILWEQLNKK